MVQALKVMISSRCDSIIPFSDGNIRLTDFRIELKKILENEKFLGQTCFDVWINDDDSAAAGADENSWEHCLNQAADSELFICLNTGEAGWGLNNKDIGICHAELETALRTGRSKVCALTLPYPSFKAIKKEDKERNESFTAYLSQLNLYRGTAIASKTDAINRIKKTIYSQLLQMARRGKVASKKDAYDRGEALDWNRLNFSRRKEAMEKVLMDYFLGNNGDKITDNSLLYSIGKKKAFIKVSAIPAALAISEAKEMVGRPQLKDHEDMANPRLKNAPGPIHVIACHRSVTENQALSVLGFPDATIIKSGFGIYVADNIQKSQMVFLEDCRDSVATKLKAQLFFDWLSEAGEANDMLGRGMARNLIVSEINKHI